MNHAKCMVFPWFFPSQKPNGCGSLLWWRESHDVPRGSSRVVPAARSFSHFMWVKQCHKRTISQENHHFIAGMFTIPRKMGGNYDCFTHTKKHVQSGLAHWPSAYQAIVHGMILPVPIPQSMARCHPRPPTTFRLSALVVTLRCPHVLATWVPRSAIGPDLITFSYDGLMVV